MLQSAVSRYSYSKNLKVYQDKYTSIHYILKLNNANKLKLGAEEGGSCGHASDLYS